MDQPRYTKKVFLLAVLLFCFLSGQDMVKGEEWKSFTNKQGDGSYFSYDRENVVRVSTTTLLVWEKRVVPTQGKFTAMKKKGEPIKMRLWEINCKKRTGKLLLIKEFDQEGNLLSSINTDESTQAELIAPRSIGEALYKAVCSKR